MRLYCVKSSTIQSGFPAATTSLLDDVATPKVRAPAAFPLRMPLMASSTTRPKKETFGSMIFDNMNNETHIFLDRHLMTLPQSNTDRHEAFLGEHHLQ